MRTSIAMLVAAILCVTVAGVSLAAVQTYGPEVVHMARLTQSQPLTDTENDMVMNAASWDALSLGTQWSLTCGLQKGPAVVKGHLDPEGNGTIMTTVAFEGGKFELCKGGPWTPGFGHMVGSITTNGTTLSYIYRGFELVKRDFHAQALGTSSEGYSVGFIIHTCSKWTEKPQFDYPAMLDVNCEPVRSHGYYGEMADVTITISTDRPSCGGGDPIEIDKAGSQVDDAPVSMPGPTWGALKIRYR